MCNGSREKRHHTRIDAAGKLDFWVGDMDDHAHEKRGAGRTNNLSFDGVCFTSDVELQPSSNLELALHLPSEGQPVRLGGEVMWCLPSAEEYGGDMFHLGVKLSWTEKADECRFTGYVCERMVEYLSGGTGG